ncbi:MAG: DNA topoisomerase 4 subunit A [Acidimicrobiia bacterium]|nr:DNA topoisomerase 4 subunit A [Actinomycetota bacterium]MBL6924014.1 DNA topoisomerase 4 subunit A [Acidimicrobiia bacterium]MBL6925612.1 DNA topoisomerase 4 subunit A [Acidimicrobiia bacterium]
MGRQQQLLPDEPAFAHHVVDVPVDEELKESFLAYSLSVITSRAIPDVRDGLKPVQRRILYAMLRMGIRPDTPHRKSARVVGDTMGRYHPHGDAAIYDALVRMGQDFARGITMVDPQGNFGSLDDPPAAPRYTECRLTEAAMAMVSELDEGTVDFRPTYDGESEEPVALPALLPGLLLNGTTGIAVGMATNMAPHNLAEVHAAISLVMKKRRPKPTIDELLAVLPGPDFPSGGIVIDDGIRQAYETGRGTIRVRARAHVEQAGRGKQAIVVTELPYQVGPERVIAKLKELVETDKVQGISDFKNLSDRSTGLRIQITVKSGHNPQAVLGELYRFTPLEETFGINNVVLVDGEPRTLGIYDLCNEYIGHRLTVIVRRTRHRIGKAEDRLHIVTGLLTALDSIDEVVAIIRGSEDTAAARKQLMKAFKLSLTQTDHILDMPLKRLTALETRRLESERDQLTADIADLKKLLSSEQRRRTLVLTELADAVEQFGHPRLTEITHPDDLPVFEVSEVANDIADEACVVTLTTSGQIGRLPVDGARRATPGRHDVLVASTVTRTTSRITAVTSEGRALQMLVAELSDGGGRVRGGSASQLFGTNRGETILTIVSGGEEPLVVVSAAGVAKRLTPDEVRDTQGGKPLIKLKQGDRLVAAFRAPAEVDMVMVASDAQALRTPTGAVSIQGRGASGVAGMKLRGDATVVGAAATIGDEALITVTSDSCAKATPMADMETRGRGGVGVRVTKLGDDTALTLMDVGEPLSLLAVMASDDDPRKPDPNPVPLMLEPGRRDLVSTSTERQVLALGPARW